jgi:pimeloyl-ACP methyl ester carboxylesterase
LFKQVSCPALLLQADISSGGVMDEDLTTITELQADNWQWKHVEGVGHGIHSEMPETFSQQLMQFFS